MSSPKKIGRWNRFEIAFNEGAWPKPSFSPSAPSRASGKTRGLRKIVKETPDAPFADLAPSAETPSKPTPENKTSSKLTSENKTPSKLTPENKTPIKLILEGTTPIPNAAELKETPVPDVASSEATLVDEVAASEKTPGKPSPSGKTPLGGAASAGETPTDPSPKEEKLQDNAASLKKPSFPSAASSPSLWTEARQRATKAKKRRF